MTWDDVNASMERVTADLAALDAELVIVKAQTDAELARLAAELEACKADANPPPQPTAPKCALGFAGPPLAGQTARRIYLNPGDPFPKPESGVLHVVTYKGPNDHAARAQQAAAYGAPVLLGFHHEPENDYAATAYKAHWEAFEVELRKAAAHNVKSWWCLMAASFHDGKAATYYPGDDLVDVIGADGYDWCGCRTSNGNATGIHKSFSVVFADVRAFARSHAKPLAIGEFGTPARADGSEADRTSWVNDALAEMKSNGMYVAACYFQHGVSDGFRCNWTLKGESLAAFKSGLADPYFGGK